MKTLTIIGCIGLLMGVAQLAQPTTVTARTAAVPAAVSNSKPASGQDAQGANTTTPIKHFVVLMEEGRSFDSIFGTYPNADGLSADLCIKLASTTCAKPALAGEEGIRLLEPADQTQTGYMTLSHYDDTHVPYFWNVAEEYVLLDRYFSSSRANPDSANWNRMFSVAGVSGNVRRIPAQGYSEIATIFDRLQESGVSWKFYVENYDPTLTYRALRPGQPVPAQLSRVPLLGFERFVDDNSLSSRIVDLNEYYEDLNKGTLPSVSYIVALGAGEATAKSLVLGQRHLKSVMQELMRSNAWSTSALLWTHDQENGWFDHVNPPQVDSFGLGPRVPALLISPFAPRGRIDSAQLEHASILRFIQENWKLKPLSRRDRVANSLITVFNFAQAPRAPVMLPMSRLAPAAAPEAPPNRTWIFVLYGSVLVLAVLAFAAILRKALASSTFSDAARVSTLLLAFGAICIFGLTKLTYAGNVPTKVTIDPIAPVAAGQPFTVTGSLHSLVQTGTVGIPSRQVQLYIETITNTTGVISPTFLVASVFSDMTGRLSWVVRAKLAQGQYRVYYRYRGSSIYIEHQAVTNLTILQALPKPVRASNTRPAIARPAITRRTAAIAISMSPATLTAGNGATITARLFWSAAAPVANELVHLDLPEVTLLGTTNADGLVTFEIKRPFTAGDVVGRVWYAGNREILPVEQALRLKVLAAPRPSIDLVVSGSGQHYVGEGHSVTALLHVNGKPLAGEFLRFSINGELRNGVRTDASGRALLRLPRTLLAGEHRISADFRGTAKLQGSIRDVSLKLLPQPFVVRTVPAIAGVALRIGEKTLVTDDTGTVRLLVEKSGPVMVSVLPFESPDKRLRAKFVRWSDGQKQSSRVFHIRSGVTLQAGLEVSRLISPRYVEGQTGREVERARLSKIVVVDSLGTTTLLEGGRPKWLRANRIVRQGDTLLSSKLAYYMHNVDVDGINVVNEGQQKFDATNDRTWTVRVQLYDMSIVTRDALFGFAVGNSVQLVDPLGRVQTVTLSADGPTHVRSLVLGSYVLNLQDAPGLRAPTPVALTRSQTVTLSIVSYLDIVVVGTLGLLIAGLTFLIGRAGLLMLMRRRFEKSVWRRLSPASQSET
jgi:phospholipase C